MVELIRGEQTVDAMVRVEECGEGLRYISIRLGLTGEDTYIVELEEGAG